MFRREGYFSAKLVDTTYIIKSFDELGEREILALAIGLEEEDSRIYKDFAERLKPEFPDTASILQSMQDEERLHRDRLTELFRKQFGEHIPLIRRQDVKGFLKRKPVWLNLILKPKRVLSEVLSME